MGDLAAGLGTATPRFEVVDRVDGDATTDFGAPGKAAAPDREPLASGEPERLAALLETSWLALDAALEAVPEAERIAKPEVGRSALTMWLHVGRAERAYLSPLLTQLKALEVEGSATFKAPRVSDPATPEQVRARSRRVPRRAADAADRGSLRRPVRGQRPAGTVLGTPCHVARPRSRLAARGPRRLELGGRGGSPALLSWRCHGAPRFPAGPRPVRLRRSAVVERRLDARG